MAAIRPISQALEGCARLYASRPHRAADANGCAHLRDAGGDGHAHLYDQDARGRDRDHHNERGCGHDYDHGPDERVRGHGYDHVRDVLAQRAMSLPAELHETASRTDSRLSQPQSRPRSELEKGTVAQAIRIVTPGASPGPAQTLLRCE